MNELSDKIEFPKGGPPIEVQLEFETGRLMSTGNHLYTAKQQDGVKAVFFADPVLNQKIQQLEPRKGSRLVIQHGRNKEWIVRKADGVSPASQPGSLAPTGPQTVPTQVPNTTDSTQLTKEQLVSLLSREQILTMLGMTLTAEQQPLVVGSVIPASGNGNGHNGNGHKPPAAPPNGDDYGKPPFTPTPTPPPPALMNGQAQFYLQHTNALIDIYVAAQRYVEATYKGSVDDETIRALAITVYIQNTAKPQGGRQ